MTNKELYKQLVEASRITRGFDGDYKDRAAESYRLTARWWDRAMFWKGIPREFRMDMESMPDGFNCPRAYGNWEEMMYEKYYEEV